MADYDLNAKTKSELIHEIRFLQHVVDFFYDAIGPADDEIQQMAYDQWVQDGNELPAGYVEDEEEDDEGEAEYGTFVGGVKVE